MKNQMKKKIALFISLVMMITLVVVPGDVKAYSESGNTITLDDSIPDVLTVATASDYNYVVPQNTELIVADGGSISGNVQLEGGTLTVKSGGSVTGTIIMPTNNPKLNIEEGGSVNNIKADSGYIYNYGKITGAISGNSGEYFLAAELNNYPTGIIVGEAKIGTNVDLINEGTMGVVSTYYVRTMNNYGSIESLTLKFTTLGNNGNIESLTAISESTVVNNEGATIGILDVTNSTVENNGAIEKLSYDPLAGGCYLTLGEKSNTGTLNLPNIGEGNYIKITATTGAKIDAADVYVDSLGLDSSGTILVNDSFKLSGESSLPSGLQISVGASTKITTGGAYSDLYVLCNGDKYLLPSQILADKTLADMYDFNVNATQIEIPVLEVGYGDAEIKEYAKTLNISNTGLGDMKCKITSIPDFVELYYGEEVLTADSTLSISNDAPKTVTIKLKAGNSAAVYSDNIVLEKWTVFNSADVTDVKTGSVNILVTAEVKRKNGEGTVKVNDLYYGEEIVPVVTSSTNGTENVTYKYKAKNDTDFTATVPTAAGEYTIQATFSQTDEYNEVVVTDDFAILRKTGTATVIVANVYYGEEIVPEVESTNGITDVTYLYKVKGADDSTYSATAPTAVGEYTIQATFAQTEEYNEVAATDDFAILRKTGIATVTVEDVYYGEEIVPVVESATNGITDVTYLYKVKGADGSTYSATAPTAAGEYTIQATFAQTEEYNEVTATDDFAILRKTGTATVTVADVYYGKLPSPVVSSETNGTASVTYMYKVKGSDDSTYSLTTPEAVGEYTIKAIIAPTDIYNEVAVTSDFKISYLPAPEAAYSISGKQGKNDYYTSEVTITPAQGYIIADTLDGTYEQSITISESVDSFNVYLKNATTGEKTAGVNVKAIKIDTKAPVILNAVDGETLYGDQIEIKVLDDNLTEVLVNNVENIIKDGTAILKLSSKNGEESYRISCSDAAGNVSEINLVVAASWMKNKMIPSGMLVKLLKECSYKLGNGTWQVSGDNTSYSGNITFYVNKDGEYIFSKIK